ncbi:hypothetical protein FHR32_003642 [Streptosporangium album]|uniref:Uncharacterized protein n=1 Tax=Streptosporangium album TaxID=47479 RepID=A0A7W7RWR5_9ACTN|nr:hypothetical protein [Streptosporangium album]MBB4939337.1 hypothetical protein [Streptosporangium album]
MPLSLPCAPRGPGESREHSRVLAARHFVLRSEAPNMPEPRWRPMVSLRSWVAGRELRSSACAVAAFACV